MNIHDHYQKMKCVISADKSQPDKALSLIKDDFVVNLKDITLEHQEWQKNRVVGTANHCAVVTQEVGWMYKNWISWCDYLWAGKSQTEGEWIEVLKAWKAEGGMQSGRKDLWVVLPLGYHNWLLRGKPWRSDLMKQFCNTFLHQRKATVYGGCRKWACV